MRRKKHKHTRRAVSFFRVHYGFREPFKVLLDGNFIYATLGANLSDLSDHVPRLLGGKCKLYTTRCVTTELQSLGSDFAAAATAARGYELQKCSHADPVAAATCLAEQLGTDNATRWWLATQDQALRRQAAKMPACPCIFASVNGLHLDEPSALAKKTVQQEESVHSCIPAHERHTKALQDLEKIRPKLSTSVRFRRQKSKVARFKGWQLRDSRHISESVGCSDLKGPNPLSIKKKVKKVTAASSRPEALTLVTALKATETAGGEGVPARGSGGGARKHKCKTTAGPAGGAGQQGEAE